NVELIQTKLRELGRPGCFVKFIQAEAPALRTQASASPPAPSLAAAAAAPKPAPAAASALSVAAARKSASAAPESAAPVKLDPSEFKNDPLIQKALEIFRGRIVEVRS
ncbi:MAG: DNA polymerase III subunit gamma/tau, partial [Verrucomicrobia bacterium]|nr:DNA polymerase III subunit gamma/tau [Verrucomicrobiota bacterium]